MEVDIKSILEGERHRKDYGDLTGMIDSIGKWGIIEPLVIRREDNLLIAGGRRFRAAQALMLDTVPIVYRDEVDDLTKLELELEENCHRKDLDFKEKALLTKRIDTLKRQKYGSAVEGQERGEKWGIEDTAKAMDVSPATISIDLSIANALEVMPEIADAPNRATALRMIDEHIEALERQLSILDMQESGTMDESIFLGDAREYLKTLPDASVDCVITDPEYGSDITPSEGSGRMRIHFTDEREPALELLLDIAIELKRVCKPNAHIYVFCSPRWDLLKEFYSILEAGLERKADPVPLIWEKDTTQLADWSQRWAAKYEFIIFFPAEGRSLKYKRDNILTYAAPSAGKRHTPVEKPVELCKELIKMSTMPGEVVLDPFVGSGPTLVGAKELGRVPWGSELDEEKWKIATLRLSEANQTKQLSLLTKPSSEQSDEAI